MCEAIEGRGVTASTSADVKDKLERRYASQSDANSLEIIRNCHSRTGTAQASDAQKVAGRWRHVVNGQVYGWIELSVDPGSYDRGQLHGEHGDTGTWSSPLEACPSAGRGKTLPVESGSTSSGFAFLREASGKRRRAGGSAPLLTPRPRRTVLVI